MSKNISASFIEENGRVKNNNTINSNENLHPTIGAVGLTYDGKF